MHVFVLEELLVVDQYLLVKFLVNLYDPDIGRVYLVQCLKLLVH